MRHLGRKLRFWRQLTPLAAAAAMLVGVAGPAAAADGSIDHVEAENGAISVLYSIPGIGTTVDPDLDSLVVSVNDEPVEAEAQLAADSGGTVRRTTVLAIDVSDSMQGQRFEQAKLAAKAFLETAPVDIFVGIVAFAGDVQVVQEPTLDREASLRVVDDLSLSFGTLLYDGVAEAIRTAGSDGQRNVLVLSDGADFGSNTELADLTSSVSVSDVVVDVVALPQDPQARASLEQIANSGSGSVLSADDPEALTELFARQAESLARQILITAQPPSNSSTTEGTLSISISADGEEYSDSAFVTVQKIEAAEPPPTKLAPVPEPPFAVSREVMLGGLAAAALAILLLLLGMFGLLSRSRKQTVEDRVGAYSRKAGTRKAAKTTAQPGGSGQGVSASAVGFAQRALASNKGLEASLGARLEAAAISMKPAEWLLVHAGIAVGAAFLGLLFSSGGIILTLVGLAFGLVGPWVYLSFRRSRRTKAFRSQLADTMQLMSGSLSAGLSLAQSVDTVVREGSEPMSGELKRALIEARLGVNIEDALESVGTRMESKDFEWVVMAIRIQREVGGNLAELLTNVAATIREREYLHRQVLALSAEGRLSTWILGGLPPAFMGYLALANPGYLSPLVSTPLGWLMCGVMLTLLTVGIFWMKKLVKVEV